MTPDQASAIAGTLGLLFFCALFLGVLAYVFWPGNAKRFDEAANAPLRSDDPISPLSQEDRP